MKQVGIVGWRGMVGSVLLQRMIEENDFDDISAHFYSYGHPGKALARRRLRQMFNEAFADLLVAVIFIKLMRSDSFFTA
nr:hypothetical protein [Klebsiella variicola]